MRSDPQRPDDLQFEPADRAVLWWPAEIDDSPGSSNTASAELVLNAANGAVKRLLGAPEETDLSQTLRALFMTGLFDGRMQQPTAEQVELLRVVVLLLIDEATPDGEALVLPP